MKKNEFPILKITDINWDRDHEKFDWIFSSLNIEQVGKWQESGCSCCSGGCSCC